MVYMDNCVYVLEKKRQTGRKKGKEKKKKCLHHHIVVSILFHLSFTLSPPPPKLNLAACLQAVAVMPCFIKTLIFQLELYAYCLIFVGSYSFFSRFTRTVLVFTQSPWSCVNGKFFSWPLFLTLKSLPRWDLCGCIREGKKKNTTVCGVRRFLHLCSFFSRAIKSLSAFLSSVSFGERHRWSNAPFERWASAVHMGLLAKAGSSGTRGQIQLAGMKRGIQVSQNLS